MRAIPGRVTEIRYQRTGRDAGAYYHRFTQPVRMLTRPDGTVLLKGARRIWADDRAPDFERYLERASMRRRNPADRTKASGEEIWIVGLLLAGLWFMARERGTIGGGTGGGGGGIAPIWAGPAASSGIWINADTGEIVSGPRPGAWPPWRAALPSEIPTVDERVPTADILRPIYY